MHIKTFLSFIVIFFSSLANKITYIMSKVYTEALSAIKYIASAYCILGMAIHSQILILDIGANDRFTLYNLMDLSI